VQQAARARFPVRVWRYSNGSERPRNDDAMIFLLRCLLCGEQYSFKTQTRNPACARNGCSIPDCDSRLRIRRLWREGVLHSCGKTVAEQLLTAG